MINFEKDLISHFSKKKYKNIEKNLSPKYNYITYGSFRSVYKYGQYVIKIPYNKNGLIDNICEAKAYQLYQNKKTNLGYYLAPCRLMKNGCLIMRHVNEDYHYNKEPKWVETIDSSQVGTYKGKFVAFDFALDLVERMDWEKEWQIKNSYYQDNYFDYHPKLNEIYNKLHKNKKHVKEI